MNILEALRSEEVKIKQQLVAIQGAITALNGSSTTVTRQAKKVVKRTMPASVRARISAKAKLRWAKIKAEQRKKK
jgi:hypothetical protein